MQRRITHGGPPRPRPHPRASDVREWSIAFQTYLRHPFVYDIGIRINHEEVLWIVKYGISPGTATLTFWRLVTGRLNLEQMLANPDFVGYWRSPESPYEVPGIPPHARLRARLLMGMQASRLLLRSLYGHTIMRLQMGGMHH